MAYLLTPGLAHSAQNNQPVYSAYPQAWVSQLAGCMTDKPLFWGGVSQVRRKLYREQTNEQQGNEERGKAEFALLPQRAFVPPGTVYWFNSLPSSTALLPHISTTSSQRNNQIPPWLRTFHTLHYGLLFWGYRQ
ncbi:MAG: hypothetical protein F6K03_14155 [Kamptonema sp. SIO4C4]|nr:hypothetical protein [Kamptonema sp. SIO4C4]